MLHLGHSLYRSQDVIMNVSACGCRPVLALGALRTSTQFLDLLQCQNIIITLTESVTGGNSLAVCNKDVMVSFDWRE